MNLAVRFIPALLTLALGVSLQVDQARAQAMINYGHGVAKAAGAGAAVGAGVGGALTDMGNPLSRAAGRQDRSTDRTETVRRQTVPTRREPISWDVPQQGFGVARVALPLVGGVKATGSTAANWQPSLLEPSQNLAVVSVSWGGPDAEASGDSTESTATEEADAGSPAEGGSGADQNSPPVVRAVGRADAAEPTSGIRHVAAAAPTVPEGIEVGLSVEQLVEKLGRPYLSFRGVAGEGYTDQYVFEMPNGEHLVVYVLDGVVAHLAAG